MGAGARAATAAAPVALATPGAARRRAPMAEVPVAREWKAEAAVATRLPVVVEAGAPMDARDAMVARAAAATAEAEALRAQVALRARVALRVRAALRVRVAPR